MSSNNKFFTIITPTLNSKKFVTQTINSVKKQTFKSYEHIIVDGCSTDGTIDILKKNKRHLTSLIIKKDKTMYEAIRKGFKIGTGKYFMWLNSDDYLYDKNSLKNLYNCLVKYNYPWVTGRISIHDQKKKKICNYPPLIYPKKIIANGLANNCAWGFIQQENTIFSKKIYNEVGGINQKFKMAGDYDLWKRLAKKNTLKSINVSIAVHRKWDGQLTDFEKYYKEIKKNKCVFNIFYPFRFLLSLIAYPAIFFRK